MSSSDGSDIVRSRTNSMLSESESDKSDCSNGGSSLSKGQHVKNLKKKYKKKRQNMHRQIEDLMNANATLTLQYKTIVEESQLMADEIRALKFNLHASLTNDQTADVYNDSTMDLDTEINQRKRARTQRDHSPNERSSALKATGVQHQRYQQLQQQQQELQQQQEQQKQQQHRQQQENAPSNANTNISSVNRNPFTIIPARPLLQKQVAKTPVASSSNAAHVSAPPSSMKDQSSQPKGKSPPPLVSPPNLSKLSAIQISISLERILAAVISGLAAVEITISLSMQSPTWQLIIIVTHPTKIESPILYFEVCARLLTPATSKLP